MRTSRVTPSRPADFEAREGGLLHSIGGQDGLCSLLEVIGLGAERRGQRRAARQ